MDKHVRSNKHTAGMTLLELMVVVAISGILMTIAMPSYSRLVLRAKASQARLILSSVYTAEKTFHLEYNSYSARFDAIGMSWEGVLHYNVAFTNDFTPPPPAPQGTPTCTQTCPENRCPAWGHTCAPSAHHGTDPVGSISKHAFTAQVHAHFGLTNGMPTDQQWTWTVNHRREFNNIKSQH